MSGFPILSIMLAVPFIAALWCLFAPGEGEKKAQEARIAALIATTVNFALGVMLWLNFEIGGPRWQFVEKADLFGRFSWALGIDGIALMLIVLSVFLMPLCILASWKSIEKRVPEYMAAFLLMETLMIGVFAAQDLFLFYIMFEGGLIPMYMIIGIWGGARR
ncbi:MAG: proton-translocating NADH-quinone oxidoreductase subunit, partial [Sphingomonas bacterium]|nr:proton-translocating NADH-quinone oxidoreductase subunit [Sphingomonas bacterium]